MYIRTPRNQQGLIVRSCKSIFSWIRYYPIDWFLKDKNGVSVRINSDSNCDKIMDKYFDYILSTNDYLPQKFHNNYISSKFKEALRAQFSKDVSAIIDVITWVEYYKNDEKDKLTNYIVINRGSIHVPFIKNYIINSNIILITHSISKLIHLLKVVLRMIISSGIFDLRLIFQRKTTYNDKLLKDNRGKIFIEYFKTNYSGARASNIWLKDINFEKKRIVYYSQRTDSLLDDDSIKIIENDGYSWLKNEKMYHYRSYFLKIKEIISIIINCPIPKRLNLTTILRYLYSLNLYLNIEYWTKIISTHNVKVLIQIEEGSVLQYAQKIALRIEGGIMIGFTWSIPFTPIRTQDFFPQDIYFTWGKINRDWQLNSKFVPDRILTAGILWDVDDQNEVIGKNIRKKFNDKIEIIMGLTDVTIKDYSKRAVFEYYKKFLYYAKKNTNWGILIKPKAKRNWEKLDIEISRLINDLILEKRLIIADEKLSPGIVAYGADLCIGMLINSGAVIAAKHGSLSLCWDATGCLSHPLYNSNNTFFVYKNLDDIIIFLDNFSIEIKNSILYEYEKSILKLIDPYNDRNAYVRIGNFIKDFIDCTDNNINVEPALNYACDQFVKTNGWDSYLETTSENLNTRKKQNLWHSS